MRISDWSSDVCSSDLGSLVGAELKARGRRFTVIEERGDLADAARNDGAEVIVGNAVDDKVLQSARLSTAAKLLVAIPEGYDAGQIVQKARASHPDLTIVARAHSARSEEHTSELQSLMRISYAVFCLKQK